MRDESLPSYGFQPQFESFDSTGRRADSATTEPADWTGLGWSRKLLGSEPRDRRTASLTELVSWQAVTTLWMVWLLYWIASALGVRRNQRGETAGQRLKTSLVLAGGAFLIFARGTPLGPLDRQFVPNSYGVRVLGLAMEVAGLLFSVWA